MEYRVEPITRSRLEAEGKRLISSYDMARIVKLWWKCLPKTKTLLRTHPYLDGVLYVATNMAYFPKAIVKNPDAITPEAFYDARVLVIPSFEHFSTTNKSLIQLQTLLAQDIKWPACVSRRCKRRCFCRSHNLHRTTSQPPETTTTTTNGGSSDGDREAIGPDNYTTLCKFLKIEYKNGDIKSYLQGGKSIIQTEILAPKVRGLRAQILCDFKVAADTLVVPEMFAHEFGLIGRGSGHGGEDDKDDYIVIDPTRIDADRLPPECLYPIDERFGVIVKRDPCIHQASLSTVSRIAITDRDNFYVSPLTMGHKNADIDGDVYGVYLIESRAVADEIRCSLHPRSSMLLKICNTTRLTFSQIHIFYMQNRLHLLSERFARYAEVARAECTRCVDYRAIDEFRRHCMPEARSEWFEPTRKILHRTAMLIAVHVGSDAAYEFFDEVNVLVTRLARDSWSCMADSLVCETLCRIAGSGAKSNIEAYAALIDKLRSVDGTASLVATDTTTALQQSLLLPPRDFAKITTVIRDMAVAARLVPQLGYNWFKTYSSWSGLHLENGCFYYNQRKVGSLDSFQPAGLIFSAEDVERLINNRLPKTRSNLNRYSLENYCTNGNGGSGYEIGRGGGDRFERKRKMILLRLCGKNTAYIESFLRRNRVSVAELLTTVSKWRRSHV